MAKKTSRSGKTARPPLLRVERDTMGEVAVPADALYGAQTARALENFPISGLRPHGAFVDATVRVKLAAARTNARLGLLPQRKTRAIERAAREILDGRWREQFVVDVYQAGAGTSHNMNVNEVIANRACELLGARRGERRVVDPNDDVNMAQSTNDVIPTAMRLAALDLAPAAAEALQDLAETFRGKARDWDDIVKSGRTHLMDATPIRLGQEVSAWATALRMAAVRILNALPELAALGIGGTAVGTGLNAHPRYAKLMVEELSRLTGAPLVLAPNPFFAMQSLAPFVALSGAARVAATELLRIGGDIRLLGSGPNTGLGELKLPPVQPGSSIMPGKVNPVVCEAVCQVTTQVIGNDAAVAFGCSAGNFELNVMLPVIARNLLESARLIARVTPLLADKCVAGIKAHVQQLRRYAESSTSIVTALNRHIGYEAAAQVAKQSLETGQTIRDVVIDRGHVKRGELSLEQLDAALDVLAMTRPRE
jgi:fumarate hydratase, class II